MLGALFAATARPVAGSTVKAPTNHSTPSSPLFSAVVDAGMADHEPARACCQVSKPPSPPLFRLSVCAAVAWVSLASIALLIWILFCFLSSAHVQLFCTPC